MLSTLRAGWRRVPSDAVLPFSDAFPTTRREEVREGYAVPTPDAPAMPMWNAAAREVQGPSLVMPPLWVAEVEHGLFCPANHALLNSSRAAVAESLGTARPHHPFRPAAVLGAEAVVPLPGVATSLRAFRWNHYHMLIDCLPRLMLLTEPRWAGLGEVQLLYAGAEPTPLERAVVQAFGLDGARFVRVEEGRLYEVERYLMLPFLSRQFSGYLPRWYLDRFRALMLPDRPGRRDRRLVLSRTGAAKRRLLNEHDLLEALAPLGFERVVLETLPFEEQIALFYDADAIVAPHGAGLTNLLFAEHARVVELFPTPYVVPHFYYLSKALGLPYQYVCGHEDNRDADFRVEVERVRRLAVS